MLSSLQHPSSISTVLFSPFQFLNLFKDFTYLFLEQGREGERERNINVRLPVTPRGDLAHNPHMCPDWESNGWPFGSQASTQSTEPQQPEPYFVFYSWGISVRKLFSEGERLKNSKDRVLIQIQLQRPCSLLPVHLCD